MGSLSQSNTVGNYMDAIDRVDRSMPVKKKPQQQQLYTPNVIQRAATFIQQSIRRK